MYTHENETTNKENRINMGCDEAVPMQTMTDLSRDTGSIAFDVLLMARKIRNHLFGMKTATNGEAKEAEPRCFRDEMERTKEVMVATANELGQIMSQRGV